MELQQWRGAHPGMIPPAYEHRVQPVTLGCQSCQGSGASANDHSAHMFRGSLRPAISPHQTRRLMAKLTWPLTPVHSHWQP